MIDIDELEALAKAPDLWQYRSKHYPEDWEISHGEPTHVSDRDYEKRSLSAIDPAAILALIAEVRALREDSADWKRRWQEAVEHASALTVERNHWQANHDNQVSRARFLIERGDIPVERVRAYGLMGALLELESAIRHDREMFAGTSDEFNPTGMLVTHALAAIDAARKEQT